MIKSVTITNYLGESIKLELRRPGASGFYIEKIEGLGPSKANINVTERSTMDGAYYTSAHATARNIVITLGFLSSGNIEEVRHKSYKYFPLKKRVNIVIETDTRTCETYGYVESNEPDIFSKNEGTQISIICPDPYFYSFGPGSTTVTMFSGTEPMFEFPFSNNSLTDKLLEFGEIKTNETQTVFYSGDVEVGVTIYIHATGNVSGPSIHNTTTGESMKIDTLRLKTKTGSEIIAGDDIVICTIKGQKSIRLIRDGVTYNILNCIDKNTDWFQLTKGDNLFMYVADEGADNLQFRIENKTAYEGV